MYSRRSSIIVDNQALLLGILHSLGIPPKYCGVIINILVQPYSTSSTACQTYSTLCVSPNIKYIIKYITNESNSKTSNYPSKLVDNVEQIVLSRCDKQIDVEEWRSECFWSNGSGGGAVTVDKNTVVCCWRVFYGASLYYCHQLRRQPFWFFPFLFPLSIGVTSFDGWMPCICVELENTR
jgi:hypothetical protein